MLAPEINSWSKNIGVGVLKNGWGDPGHKVNGWNELILCMLMQI